MGETARSGKERMGNHDSDARSGKRQAKSHMFLHTESSHPGTTVKWRFKVERRFSSPMYRQIAECIRIRALQHTGALILKKKEEYSR